MPADDAPCHREAEPAPAGRAGARRLEPEEGPEHVVPSLGPIYARPELFADLPETGVSELGTTLLEHRREVIADPFATDAVQGIAGFASLHVAVIFTAALVAHLTGAPRPLRIALWSR